jgi:GTP-binding protein Era
LGRSVKGANRKYFEMIEKLNKAGKSFRCGFVGIGGRANVGKSTLMNRLLGQDLAIATPKAQTTRNQIRGIFNGSKSQIIFVDTPGIPKRFETLAKADLAKNKQFHKYLLEEALSGLSDVDCLVYVLDAQDGLTPEDIKIWEILVANSDNAKPVLITINKVDASAKDKLLPLIQSVQEKLLAKYPGVHAILLCSAKTGDGMDVLLTEILKNIPNGPPLYPEDQMSDQNDRFIAAEIVRERLFLSLRQEIPYSTAVQISEFTESDSLIRIRGVIFVERDSQKGMVIGKKGSHLKKVGTQARMQMAKVFKKNIFLDLRVRVLKNWSHDEKFLKQLGYSVDRKSGVLHV